MFNTSKLHDIKIIKYDAISKFVNFNVPISKTQYQIMAYCTISILTSLTHKKKIYNLVF